MTHPTTARAPLLQSRKAWAAIFGLLGIAVATTLRVLDKLPADAFLPVVLGIAGLGSTFIGGVAVEDAAAKLAARPSKPSSSATLFVVDEAPAATPASPTKPPPAS